MRCIEVLYSKPFENFIAPHTTEYRYNTHDPYSGYNFWVEWDGIVHAGFRECSGLTATRKAGTYREGTDKTLTQRQIPGLIAVFSRMRGNKILERLTVKDSNTPHSCDYRYNNIGPCVNGLFNGSG